MTVSELIKALESYDPDLPVVMDLVDAPAYATVNTITLEDKSIYPKVFLSEV